MFANATGRLAPFRYLFNGLLRNLPQSESDSEILMASVVRTAGIATTGSSKKIFGLPWDVFLSLFLMTATSSYVIREPAPCDLAFVLVAPLMLITGRFALVRPANPLLYFGIFLFFALNTISLAVAYEVLVSLRYYMITVYLLLYFLLVVSLVARYGSAVYRVLNGSFQIGALITSTIGILAGLHVLPNWNEFMLTEKGERIRSTFKDSNVLGPYLVAACAMLVADAFVRKKLKLWQVVCLTIYSVAILMTYSRGAYLAGIVTFGSLAGMFWLQPHFRRASETLIIRLIPVGVLIVLAGVFVLHETDLTEFFVNRFAYQSYDDVRFENQQHILQTIGQDPVGIGPGSWNLHNYLHDVHSLFLRTWVEHGHLGMIGLLCFLFAWVTDTWRGVRRKADDQYIYIVSMAIFLGVMSNSFSIDTVHWRHLFMIMAIPVGLIAHEARKADE